MARCLLKQDRDENFKHIKIGIGVIEITVLLAKETVAKKAPIAAEAEKKVEISKK
jgi:hypothetical protein